MNRAGKKDAPNRLAPNSSVRGRFFRPHPIHVAMETEVLGSWTMFFHLLKNVLLCSLLVLKGIDFTTGHVFISSRGRTRVPFKRAIFLVPWPWG